MVSRSADTIGGWQNHHRRMKRWKDRVLKKTNKDANFDFDEIIDFSLTYFVWCHSLRDWLIKSDAITQSVLDTDLSNYDEWTLCRDIANRCRHLELTRNPRDKDWMIFRTYDPCAAHFGWGPSEVLILYFDGERYVVTDMVRHTDRMWDEILDHHIK